MGTIQRSGVSSLLTFAAFTYCDPITTTVAVFDGAWHHVACTYDGVNRCIYVDGLMNVQKPTSGSLIPTTEIAIMNMQMSLCASIPYPNREFGGLISEVRLWNTCRSALEISGNENAWLSSSKSGLVSCYNCRQAGNVTTLSDLTNANPGTLTNFPQVGNNWVAGPFLS
jgi:Concanavalin A-like lectin/glucanases superfamily